MLLVSVLVVLASQAAFAAPGVLTIGGSVAVSGEAGAAKQAAAPDGNGDTTPPCMKTNTDPYVDSHGQIVYPKENQDFNILDCI